MQPMMAAYYPTNVTTDHIQQYLDENKSLILKIVESQNSGKLSECAENQARLQRNLMYLAAIADSQPQPPNIHSQYPSGGIMQAGAHYLQHQQAAAAQQQQQQQQMTPQSLMAARSASMLYGTQPYQSQQQQQQALLGGGSLMLQGEPHGFPDFVRSSSGNTGDGLRGLASGSKQDGEGRDGGETLYLKSAEDGN